MWRTQLCHELCEIHKKSILGFGVADYFCLLFFTAMFFGDNHTTQLLLKDISLKTTWISSFFLKCIFTTHWIAGIFYGFMLVLLYIYIHAG